MQPRDVTYAYAALVVGNQVTAAIMFQTLTQLCQLNKTCATPIDMTAAECTSRRISSARLRGRSTAKHGEGRPAAALAPAARLVADIGTSAMCGFRRLTPSPRRPARLAAVFLLRPTRCQTPMTTTSDPPSLRPVSA